MFWKVRTFIIVGLIARLLIAPFFANPFDIFSFYVVGQSLLSGQREITEFLIPYQYSYFLFLFPMTILFRFLSTFIPTNTIPMSSIDPSLIPSVPTGITLVPGLLFNFLVKLPLIVSDTLVALFIYRLCRHYLSDKDAAFASALWFLNPLVIWVSSGWGMFDTLASLFSVVSLYFVLQKKFVSSGISFVLSIAMKYYAVIFAFPLAILSWENGRVKGFLRILVSVLALSAALFLPLLGKVISAAPSMAGISNHQVLSYSGLSIFNLITLFSQNSRVGMISFSLTLSSLGFAYIILGRNRALIKSHTFFFAVGSFTLPLIFLLMFYQFVGANFLIWIMPFIAILAVNNKRRFLLYSILSLIGLTSSFINSLLPFNMLPLYPWLGKYLVAIVHSVSSYRIAPTGTISAGISLGKVVLSGLGIGTFVILVLFAYGLIVEMQQKSRRL